jgi:hypothetical protein
LILSIVKQISKNKKNAEKYLATAMGTPITLLINGKYYKRSITDWQDVHLLIDSSIGATNPAIKRSRLVYLVFKKRSTAEVNIGCLLLRHTVSIT